MTRFYHFLSFVIVLACFVFVPLKVHSAVSWQFDVSAEGLDFLLERAHYDVNDQETLDAKFTFEYDNKKNVLLFLQPRLRWDFFDTDRNRYLPNEFYLKFYGKTSEFSAGLQTRAFGVSNAFNPTDVFTRKDLGDNFFTPERLGDVVLSYKYSIPSFGAFDDLTFELMGFPFFQNTPLPGEKSRFAVAGTISGISFTLYDTQDSPDLADSLGAGVRVAATLKSCDAEILLYHGPEHQPTFFMMTSNGRFKAVPYYYTIDMVGANISKSQGPFVLHLETALKITELNPIKTHAVPFVSSDVVPNNYFQFVPGIDYTIDDLFHRGGTLLISLEYLGEEEHSDLFEEFRPFKSDVFLGLRYEFNNTRQMRFQAGVMKDLLNQEMIVQTQFHSVIKGALTFDFESLILNQDSDPEAPLSLFENNTYVAFKLNYAFGGDV